MKSLLVLLLLLVGLVVSQMQLSTHHTDEGKVLAIDVSVDVYFEKTNVFKTVYNGTRSFEWDSKNKLHKLCIGSTSPSTKLTTCQEENRKVSVIHVIDDSYNHPDNVCLYVNFKTHECRPGSDTGVYYTEQEVMRK